MVDLTPREVIYKTAKGNEGEEISIPLDVYLPSSSNSSSSMRLVPLIWIHTGGFLQGTRRFIPAHFLRSVNKHNYAVIAPDFRLAPQVTLASILKDIHDCIHFVLSGKVGGEIDTSQYILAGSSAGGWASLLLGLNLLPSLQVPTPSALISIYPITTVSRSHAPYFYTPLRPLPWAYSPNAKVGDAVPEQPLREHMDKNGRVRTEAPPAKEPARATLYNYSRQEGTYPSLILGEGDKAEDYCVASQIQKQLNGGRKTPDLVYIAYGDADVMVETSQSDMVIEALSKSNVSVKTHVEPGKSHVWDILDPEAEIGDLWDSVSQALRS
jgi:acetyl esterase/lipase